MYVYIRYIKRLGNMTENRITHKLILSAGSASFIRHHGDA